jgi:hypothetical protein
MPKSATIPEDIQQIVSALDAASGHAETLFASAPAAVLEASLTPGSWSPAQCLAHLAATNFAYLGAMRAACKPALHLHLHERSGPLRPGWPTRWFLAQLEPPPRRRLPAPRVIVPPPAVTAGVALRDFQSSQAAAKELLLECRHLDLNRIRFANPFVPLIRFTVGAGFLIIAAHERRHLWQAAQSLPPSPAMAPSKG